MNKFSLSLVAGLVFTSQCAFAANFAEQCPDVAVCAKAVGELLGQKYIFDGEVKGAIKATPNLELTKENAEVLFTNALNMNGFSRVPLAAKNTYQIMKQRDARDAAIPFAISDAKTAPTLPDTWDLYTMTYKASHPETVDQIARLTRSFMPANSRIVSAEWSGELMITDTAPNLKKIYELIKTNDVKPSAEMLKKWQHWELEGEKRRLAEAGVKKFEETPVKAPQAPTQKN